MRRMSLLLLALMLTACAAPAKATKIEWAGPPDGTDAKFRADAKFCFQKWAPGEAGRTNPFEDEPVQLCMKAKGYQLFRCRTDEELRQVWDERTRGFNFQCTKA